MNEPITQSINAVIPTETARQAVRLASASARMKAYSLQAKATRKFLRDLMQADEDYKQAQELKAEIKKSTTATREEIKALEQAAEQRAIEAHPDKVKILNHARLQVASAKQIIEQTIADSGQLFLRFSYEV